MHILSQNNYIVSKKQFYFSGPSFRYLEKIYLQILWNMMKHVHFIWLVQVKYGQALPRKMDQALRTLPLIFVYTTSPKPHTWPRWKIQPPIWGESCLLPDLLVVCGRFHVTFTFYTFFLLYLRDIFFLKKNIEVTLSWALLARFPLWILVCWGSHFLAVTCLQSEHGTISHQPEGPVNSLRFWCWFRFRFRFPSLGVFEKLFRLMLEISPI